MAKTRQQRWAWALTGSGHFFQETFELIASLPEVDVFMSPAADELLSMYRVRDSLPSQLRIFRDSTASAVPVGRFYENLYHTLVMAPVSSNTVAKCVYGISDSLVSNVFAQAGKCRVECVVFPCDTAEELISAAPKGDVTVYPRAIDLDNVTRLQAFERTRVALSFADLRQLIGQRADELAS